MAESPELKALVAELDNCESRLSRTAEGDERERIEQRIAELIRAIQEHREHHSGCDFKPTVQ